MLFVGGFRHPPNVDAALWLADEIMPLVLRQHPTARLTIVGADVPDAVRRRAGDAIDVVGRVDDVEPFVASSSLVVAPLRAGGGMRLKVLQAMAAARPVVTTTRGAAGIWNPAGAPTLLIADDAAGIATHVASLLASESARQALGARAREAAINHHRWDQFAERLHAIYDEVLASGAAA
jgi:glycosyltransferase involved in cell wall biosynthesis